MMHAKPGKLNWKGLFAGDPNTVTVVQTSEGRTFGSDRYSLWDLSAVCEAQGVDVPRPGRYRAMAKELRPERGEALLPADKLAALFEGFVRGIERDPDDRLVVSEWANGHHRPIIHPGTGDVRLISAAWDALPRLSTGNYWVACADWKKTNAAVCWGMYEQAPFGVVQLVGPASGSADVWNLTPYMAFALALDCGMISDDVIAARYPNEAKLAPVT